MVGPRSLWSQGGPKAPYTLNCGMERVLNFYNSIGFGTQSTSLLASTGEEVSKYS